MYEDVVDFKILNEPVGMLQIADIRPFNRV